MKGKFCLSQALLTRATLAPCSSTDYTILEWGCDPNSESLPFSLGLNTQLALWTRPFNSKQRGKGVRGVTKPHVQKKIAKAAVIHMEKR